MVMTISETRQIAQTSLLAAFAPVSGAFYIANSTGNTCDPSTIAYNPDLDPAKECTPGRPDIPMLEFHGLHDKTINYTGGVRRKACLPTIPHWIQTWAEKDGLGTTNVSSAVPEALAGSTAVRYEFGEGQDQGLVTHIMDGTVSVYNSRCEFVAFEMVLTRLRRISGMTGLIQS